MFQSTHPHGVRLVRQIVIMTYESVSIHAPTRGATLHGSVLRRGIRVSIHAPTRGATHAFCDLCYSYKFQSTHPHGVRPLLKSGDIIAYKVSIHAPTRGATLLERHTEGVDEFQSTHPHGVRHPIPILVSPWICFNPRTHTGCDS